MTAPDSGDPWEGRPVATPESNPYSVDWRTVLPQNLFTGTGPYASEQSITSDRRLLWYVQNALVNNRTPARVTKLQRALRSYLVETCAHDDRHYDGAGDDDPVGEHLQCQLCYRVVMLPGDDQQTLELDFGGERDMDPESRAGFKRTVDVDLPGEAL